MTRRLLASIIFVLHAAPLLAQKDMGQAQQYYRQTPPTTKRFKVLQRTPQKGGEIKWQASSQQIVIKFADQGCVPRASAHLGNARAHKSAADYANSSDVHRGSV